MSTTLDIMVLKVKEDQIRIEATLRKDGRSHSWLIFNTSGIDTTDDKDEQEGELKKLVESLDDSNVTKDIRIFVADVQELLTNASEVVRKIGKYAHDSST